LTPSQLPGSQDCDLLFARRVGEIDPAFLDAVEDRSDGLRPAERPRHRRIDRLADLLEVRKVPVGENESFHFFAQSPVIFDRRHQLHYGPRPT
jgi:hypothetical protein